MKILLLKYRIQINALSKILEMFMYRMIIKELMFGPLRLNVMKIQIKKIIQDSYGYKFIILPLIGLHIHHLEKNMSNYVKKFNLWKKNKRIRTNLINFWKNCARTRNSIMICRIVMMTIQKLNFFIEFKIIRLFIKMKNKFLMPNNLSKSLLNKSFQF